jgi:hypothetical protein
MSPDDRRRLTLATIITLVALPALWLMQRDDTAPGSPTVAAAGAPAPPAVDAAADATEGDPPPPAYLEGPSTTAPVVGDTPLVIATGDTNIANRLSGTAGYQRFDDATTTGTCHVNGAPLGVTITVRNVDNDRTTTCVNASTARGDDGEIAVLDIAVFLQIADLVDAPLPVELTW